VFSSFLAPILRESELLLDELEDYIDEVGKDVNLRIEIVPLSAFLSLFTNGGRRDMMDSYRAFEVVCYMNNRYANLTYEKYEDELSRLHIETEQSSVIFDNYSEFVSDRFDSMDVILCGYKDSYTTQCVLACF
jgi:hypothetical protein